MITLNLKRCTKCGEEKPETKEFFSFEGGSYRADCKECRKKYRQATREQINFTERQRRAANRDYYLEKKRRYKSINKERIAAQTKEYKERNKEVIREKDRIYRLGNKERESQRTREWYIQNKEWASKRGKAWKERNKERILRLNKEYYNINRDVIREKLKLYRQTERGKQLCRLKVNKRRAMKKKLENSLTVEQWKGIQNAFDYCCAYCGCNDQKLVQEHFIALSKGGEFSLNNILPSCAKCNISKSTKDFHDWYRGYKYYSAKRQQKILSHLKYYGENQQLALTI